MFLQKQKEVHYMKISRLYYSILEVFGNRLVVELDAKSVSRTKKLYQHDQIVHIFIF